MEPEFKRINCDLLGLSIDSNPSHLAWIYNIAKNTGITIPFPIIADRDGKIAMKYNMVSNNNIGSGTVRSVYVICPNGNIRAILTYPKEIGRNIGEILRLVTALQISDACNVVTPANWCPGANVITKPPQTYCELIERVKNPKDLSCLDWYLCFQPDKCKDKRDK